MNHLPEPSYYPILLAFGVVLLAGGALFTPILAGIGLTVILVSVVGWTQENRDQGNAHDE